MKKSMLHILEAIIGSLIVFSILLLFFHQNYQKVEYTYDEMRNYGISCIKKLDSQGLLRNSSEKIFIREMRNCLPPVINVSLDYSPEDKEVVVLNYFVYGDKDIDPKWITIRVWLK